MTKYTYHQLQQTSYSVKNKLNQIKAKLNLVQYPRLSPQYFVQILLLIFLEPIQAITKNYSIKVIKETT